MTRDELRENVRCSLFDEQDTDAVMADVDRYVKAILQQTPCTVLRVNLAQLLIEEQELAKRWKKRLLTKVYHAENARSIERVIKMIDERQPVA